MTTLLHRFIDDGCGATAIEYGLIAALVSVSAISALSSLGSSLAALFTNASSTVNGAVSK